MRYDAGDVEELCHSQRAVLQPCDEEHEEPKVTGQLQLTLRWEGAGEEEGRRTEMLHEK